jgi:hypothetical protein
MVDTTIEGGQLRLVLHKTLGKPRGLEIEERFDVALNSLDPAGVRVDSQSDHFVDYLSNDYATQIHIHTIDNKPTIAHSSHASWVGPVHETPPDVRDKVSEFAIPWCDGKMPGCPSELSTVASLRHLINPNWKSASEPGSEQKKGCD